MKPLKISKEPETKKNAQMIWELLKVASTLYIVFALPSVFHLQCISKARYILSNFSVVVQIRQ